MALTDQQIEAAQRLARQILHDARASAGRIVGPGDEARDALALTMIVDTLCMAVIDAAGLDPARMKVAADILSDQLNESLAIFFRLKAHAAANHLPDPFAVVGGAVN